MDKALTAEVARLAESVEQLLALQRGREREERWQQREKRPVRRPERAGLGLFLSAIPGLAARFEKTVPSSHVVDGGVSCTCGQKVTLTLGDLAQCTCGRWFLHAGATIRVHRPERSA